MTTLGLIDADSIYFRAAMVQTKKNEIRKIIDRTMKEIEGELFMPQLMVAVKGHGNWRKDLYPQYKAQRPELSEEKRKALAYAWQYMIDKWGGIKADGMEADDLVSIWAAEARTMETDYVVVGIDKDLLQIPGKHYNFVKKTHQEVAEEDAAFNLMLQCLTGDNSDNIPGIKGVGPVKARKILNGIPKDRQWNRVRATWRAHRAGDPELSRRLLTMLTSWDEYEELKTSLSSEAPVSEQDVREEGQDNVQDS